MIQAILAPERLQAVTALLADAEIFRMTVSEVHGVSDMHRVAFSELSPEPMVRIEVGDKRIRLDFTGSSPQVPGNVNCTMNATQAAVTYTLKALLDPELPNNPTAETPAM